MASYKVCHITNNLQLVIMLTKITLAIYCVHGTVLTTFCRRGGEFVGGRSIQFREASS